MSGLIFPLSFGRGSRDSAVGRGAVPGYMVFDSLQQDINVSFS